MDKLSPEEKVQYDRHLILGEIGESGQQKLKQAKVLVVGAGGLGCPVLQYLTAAGVGTIGIIDGDSVDQSNLQRQILYSMQDIGKSKADTVVKKLRLLNPYISLTSIPENLTTQNAISLFEGYDIIVDGTDNFPTRYLINDAAVLTGKPIVFGSIFKFEGQVSVFNHENGPTYRCLFPSPPEPGSVPNCSDIGVMGILPGIIGCLQANEVIKLICEIGNPLSGRLLTYNALNAEQMVFKVSKNPEIKVGKLLEDYSFFCGLKTYNEIDKSKLAPDNVQLLDVRSLKERQTNHIGGIHIPLQELEKRSNELDSNQDLVIYCKSGNRSKKAIDLLIAKGFNEKQLFNLTGGIG